MAHSFSKTWLSNEARELERFQSSRIHYEHICRKSPLVPRTHKAWLEHRSAIATAKGDMYKRMVTAKEETREASKKGIQNVVLAFKGKSHKDNRSAVLCEPTIWSPNVVLKPELAPWPTLQEAKWEGDDRAATANGRFLPLPRSIGNATVAWHHIPLVETYIFDEVRRVPTIEDILAPVDEIMKEEASEYLDRSLIDALDGDDLL